MPYSPLALVMLYMWIFHGSFLLLESCGMLCGHKYAHSSHMLYSAGITSSVLIVASTQQDSWLIIFWINAPSKSCYFCSEGERSRLRRERWRTIRCSVITYLCPRFVHTDRRIYLNCIWHGCLLVFGFRGKHELLYDRKFSLASTSELSWQVPCGMCSLARVLLRDNGWLGSQSLPDRPWYVAWYWGLFRVDILESCPNQLFHFVFLGL